MQLNAWMFRFSNILLNPNQNLAMLSPWSLLSTCKNSCVAKINCATWRQRFSGCVCEGLTEPELHNPAQCIPQRLQEPSERVYKADTGKPPKGSVLRGTEAPPGLLFFLKKLPKGLQKTLLDRVNSDMSHISSLPTLPWNDSSSWTDFTFLLTPAIRPGHFLPSRLYFR